MDAAAAALYFLLAVVPKSMREHGGRVGPAPARRAVVAILVVESSLGVLGAPSLYPRLAPTAGLLLPPESECHQQTLRLHSGLRNGTLWAERMVDASARVVVGGLWGARFQLGSFDGCLAAGASSPVGARYCLARLSPAAPGDSQRQQPSALSFHPRRQPHRGHRPCAADHPPWDHVSGLAADADARDALQGCGLVAGSIPLADVLVALCVPESCGPAALQEALSKSLLRGTALGSFDVRVHDEHCVSHSELRDGQLGSAPLFFWTVVAALSAATLAAPYLGGALSAWDWRVHVAALAQPDVPLSGLDLTALSGMRAINMILVVAAHRCFNAAKLPTSNQFINTAESRTSPMHAVGHHAALLVDTCFFMSGLLMSLSPTLRPSQRHGKGAHTSVGTTLRATANRYLRLTPPYALVMLFYATTMETVGSGPLWKAITTPEAAACRRWWWSNLLYANNYVHGEDGEYGCMLQSWSLAVDMQQFVLGTVLVPLLLSTTATWRWAACGLVATLLPPFVATLAAGWPAMLVWSARAMENPFADPMFYSLYVATQFRAAPYVVGVVAGCVMLRLKERQLELNHSDSTALTWCCLVVLKLLLASSVLFGDLGAPPAPALAAALYAALCPAAWAATMALLLVVLTFGQRTAVAALLRWQPLVTLSRLSYGVYLVHFAVQLLQGGGERSPLNVTIPTVARDSFSDVVMSLMASFWLHLVVEAPARTLAKKALWGASLSRPKLDVGEPSRKRTASEASPASPDGVRGSTKLACF